MTDLPDQVNTSTPPSRPSTPISVTTVGGKEFEAVMLGAEDGLRGTSGPEVDALPKEVASAGVRVHPTTIPIPPPIANLGVKPSGQNIPAHTTTVTLPISDDQVVAGLKQGITSSWRWLSVWCLRRLKQVHVVLQSIRGRVVRVRR